MGISGGEGAGRAGMKSFTARAPTVGYKTK